MICTGCKIDRTVTVTFRDANGVVQTRCVRCGGAESTPEPPITLKDVKPPVRGKRK